MAILAVVRIEGDPSAASQAIASVAKCSPYDARMRLAAGLPAVVARVDASRVDRSDTVDVIAAVLHRACALGLL